MSEDELTKYKLKFNLKVFYIDGEQEEFKDLTGVRFGDTAVSFVKNKIINTGLYKNQGLIPYSAIKVIDSEIVEIEEVE